MQRHLKLFWFPICLGTFLHTHGPGNIDGTSELTLANTWQFDEALGVCSLMSCWLGHVVVDGAYGISYLNRCKNSSIFFHVTPCRQSQEALWELRRWTILAHQQMWKTGVSSHVQHWHRLKMAAKENSPGEKLFSTGTWRPWFKGEIVNNQHPFSTRWIEGSIWKKVHRLTSTSYDSPYAILHHSLLL